MIDESKVKDESLELSDLEGEQSIFNFQTLYAMLVLNWQWYLLSLFICLCGALIYLRYATPVYQVSAKMLIKADENRSGSAEQVLSSMQTLGVMSNSSGIENEMEIIKSRFLAHDVVKDLKLYVQYYSSGRLKQQLMYKAQPVSVDLDSVTLESWDKGLQEGVKSISLSITKLENSYQVEGEPVPEIQDQSTTPEKSDSPAANEQEVKAPNLSKKGGKTVVKKGDDLRK